MKPDQYARFYHDLVRLGFEPIISPAEYGRMHCFPSAARSFANQTPTYRVFPQTNGEIHLDAHEINETFHHFMMKDYVKSLKGTSFPACIKTPITQEELDELVGTFIQLRDELFTGGIVVKAYVDLKHYNEATNEWRMFVLYGRVLGMCHNSNQPTTTPAPPQALTEAYTSLDSPFYTLDFAELEDESWTIIEAGDGQVSGLAAADHPTRFYEQLACINADYEAQMK